MKSHAIADELISAKELALYLRVRNTVASLGEVDLGTVKNNEGGGERPVDPSCHVFADAVAKVFPELRVCDGYFTRDINYQHSWLVTPELNVIDVSPPTGIIAGATITPIMVENHGARTLYRQTTIDPFYFELRADPVHQRAVAILEQALRETLATLPSAS